MSTCPINELSEKQADFIQNSDARQNIASGAVRSGKSVGANLAFLKFTENPIRGNFIIIGRTEKSIQENILGPFSDYLGKYFDYRSGKRYLNYRGRQISVVSAHDIKAEANIRGSTYAAALVDEITVIPEPVYKQLLARLSVPGARLFGTTNPDSPYHWFKRDYLDRKNDGIDIKHWEFTFDDNPFLDEKYKNALKSEYEGLWYKRFIEGKWVLAQGAIFDFFDDERHIIASPPNFGIEYAVGVDYGTTNPCAFVLVGYHPEAFPKLWIEKEYYYESQKRNRQKTDSEYAEDLASFIENYPVRGIYVDPSAASFKAQLRRVAVSNLFDADNDVINGIRYVSELLNDGTFKVCKNCTHTISEFGNYLWDPQSSLRGVEKPLKKYDHLMDALRYVLYSRYKHLGKKRVTQADLDSLHNSVYQPQSNLPPFFQHSSSSRGFF